MNGHGRCFSNPKEKTKKKEKKENKTFSNQKRIKNVYFFFLFFFLELGELMAAASRTRLCIQEWMKSNRCYGCGAQNEKGLNLKSLWNPEDRTAEASFIAKPEHCAGPPHFVNGGILSTLIDCHGICLALADAQDRMGKPLGVDGNQNSVWYVTGSLNVKFARSDSFGFSC